MRIVATASGSSERKERRFRRFNLEFPVSMKFRSGGLAVEVDAMTKNISIGGFSAKCASMILLHTAVTFRICVRREETGRSLHLTGEGEVVRVESSASDSMLTIAVNCRSPITEFDEDSSAQQADVN